MNTEGVFTPKIIDKEGGYGILMVRLRKCKYCGGWMFDEENSYPSPCYENGIDKQLERAGWKKQGYVGMQTLDVQICEECVGKDAKTFLCAICGKQKKSSEIEECIGYSAEYLCKDCFSSISAKEWDEKVEELEEKHKWDYSS
jgi:hypothetical protein